MANNKMLIDASHPEETRVVVLRGNRIEEFDFESANKMPLRGNVYLAKVTRVEPSLQAAFVEYGGNRHGFLAFSEIHPDYYQIPVADRQALLEDEARARRDEDDEEEQRRSRPQQQQQRRGRRVRRNGDRGAQRSARNDESISGDVIASDAPQPDISGEHAFPVEGLHEPVEVAASIQTGDETQPNDTGANNLQPADLEASPAPGYGDRAQPVAEPAPALSASEHTGGQPDQDVRANAEVSEARADAEGPVSEDRGETSGRDDQDNSEARSGEAQNADAEDGDDEAGEEEESVEQIGGDELEEMSRPVRRTRRQYKIQEVIKRRQVLLVQVVKEERGTKGAALTTYLSLAGRYSVLMPNTARGGGISRKITDSDDRKRLREIAGELDVPDGMGVILRTAGAARGKDEVQRDFEYLLRMWESVRELTLRSMAPALVYEEGSLVKRSIRDLYGKEIEEIQVSGMEAYKEARDFMSLLMPGHVNNVREWKEPQPLFARFGVEQQLDSMFSNVVTLKSGGYIVVNQTEALVAIDVNSGRSTREHNIEDTALRTNMEAADEVARQLRLRDLAGLIVVDFIDMEEFRNNRAVERRMKDALKNDRARIQVGRISHFGLLEMSRQRMRPGVLEGSSVVCPHCAGVGTVRSTASVALHVLRLVEDSLIRSSQFNLNVRTRTEVALYILNQKRAHLRELEERFGVTVAFLVDETLSGSTYHVIERGEPAVAPVSTAPRPQQIRVDSVAPVYEDEDDADEAAEEVESGDDEPKQAGSPPRDSDSDDDSEDPRRNKRRRRRRSGRNRESSGIEADAPQPSDESLAAAAGFTDGPRAYLAAGSPREGTSGEAPEGALTEGGAEPVATGEEQQDSAERFGQRRGNRRRRGGRGREFGGEARGEPRQNGNWVRSPESGEAPAWQPEPGPAYANGANEAAVAHEPQDQPMASAREESATIAHAPPAQMQSEAPAPAIQMEAPAPQAPAPSQVQTQADNAKAAEAEAREAEAEAARKRQIETLPEAPPPEQKRGGWWQRARSALGG